MRKIILLLFFIGLSQFIEAKSIDANTAKAVAITYMKYRNPDKIYSIKEVLSESENNELLYYIITFNEGGWIMVAADDQIIPVLGYSFDGSWGNEENPPAFESFIASYRNKIKYSKSLKTISKQTIEAWGSILTGEILKRDQSQSSRFVYTPNTPLVTAQWGQSTNNDRTCTTSYNQFTPNAGDTDIGCVGTNDDKCNCDHKPVGCGPVAMGQIMQFWRFPNSSSYRSYDWSLMPNEITNNSINEAEEIAHLLADCGSGAGTTYCCAGAYTFTNKMVDALKTKFKFKGVESHKRPDWSPEMWLNLIKAEIDAGRPVIYRADEPLVTDDFEIGGKHIFICDGYRNDPLEFHFNWGWKGGFDNYFNIYNLNPGSSNFTENHDIIVGISPSCNEISQDIIDLNYTSVIGEFINEQARNSISLPADGKSLTISSDAKLIMTAGEEIKLKPGFSASFGSEFRTSLRSMGYGEIGISDNYAGPNPIKSNQTFCISVNNADAWECRITSLDGKELKQQTAGSVVNENACVWTPNSNLSIGTYLCILKLRNSCGELWTKTYKVYYAGRSSSRTTENFEEVDLVNETPIEIFPNPSKGIFTIKINDKSKYEAIVVDIYGKVVYQTKSIGTSYTFDLTSMPKGLYFIKASNKIKSFTKKIVIE